jgi:alpha-glucosidase
MLGKSKTLLGILVVLGCVYTRCVPAVAGAAVQTKSSVKEPGSSKVTILWRVDSFTALRNGIELRSGPATMRITAVDDGIVRVQVSSTASICETHSWALVAGALDHKVEVQHTRTLQSIGFTAGSVQVTVERNPLRVVVSDRKGREIVADAPDYPLTFHGDAFEIHKTMAPTEHFFGLGDKTGPLDHRDEAFSMWNTDAYHWQESTDPLYKSVPFFLAIREGLSYGIFLDNTWRSQFDFGKQSPNAYSFGAEGGMVDYYILTGDEPKDIVRRYTALTGRPAMPPRWALGYQQSRWSYEPEARVREVAEKLRNDRIPADVLFLDIAYQDRNRPFTVDRTRFPHFESLIADLAKMHLHIVAITDLHIAAVAKGEYAPGDAGMAEDRFVHAADGSVYTGSVWPGPAHFPEFTQQAARAWWGALYSNFYLHDHIGGFWNDMNEPSVFRVPSRTMPLDVVHRVDEPGWPKRDATHAEIHNVFGMLNSRATYEGLLALDADTRPFVLTRASFAGGQRYAATWTGDNSSTWNHLRISTHQLVNLGISGFAFAGADIGGYAGSPSMDLLTRWLEIGAFNAIDRDHTESGTADQEPWVGGPEQEAIRRRYIEERYRLMPYLYTLAHEASSDGIPMMRAMFLEFPFGEADGTPMDVDYDNQFMLGPALLVAPQPFPDTQDGYKIAFPRQTEWYDYWSGRPVTPKADGEGATGLLRLEQPKPALDHLPVFVRAGSVVPVQPLVQSTDETPDGPLTLRVYLPQANGDASRCGGDLYTDDGISFAFRTGQFYSAHIECNRDPRRVTVGMDQPRGAFVPWWKEFDVALYGVSQRPAQVELNGKPMSDANIQFEPNAGILHLRVPASGDAWRIAFCPDTVPYR